MITSKEMKNTKVEKLTKKQLARVPDNWNLRHNINDLEYWFTGEEFDIQLVKDDWYGYWEINELKGECKCCGNPKGRVLKRRKLNDAFLMVEAIMKGG